MRVYVNGQRRTAAHACQPSQQVRDTLAPARGITQVLRGEEVIAESHTAMRPPSRLALTDVVEQRRRAGGGTARHTRT